MSAELPRAAIALTPIPVPWPWGGRQIAAYLKRNLPPGRIGELVQVSGDTVVAGGPLAGERLGELAHRFGPALLGSAAPFDRDDGAFPLVVRFLDAPSWGPVHVQLPPPDRPLAGAEVWHVLAAHAGSGAVLGLLPGLARADDLLALPIREAVHRRDLRPGETILLPPGLVHTLGGGALVFGLLVPGARTVALEPEGSHHDAEAGSALDAPALATPADLGTVDLRATAGDGHATPGAASLPLGRPLMRWAGWALERSGLLAPYAEIHDGTACAFYTPIAGELEIAGENGVVRLAQGETACVPAGAGRVELRPAGKLGVCTLIKTYPAGSPDQPGRG